MSYTLAIHGGAGTILKSEMTPQKEQRYHEGLRLALLSGEDVLRGGGTAMDAVCSAVECLEDNPLFNAGKGSVFTHDGKHEMDAAVMDGTNREAGAVCGVSGVKNPVLLARLVMEQTNHVMLSGNGAFEFAQLMRVELRDDSYFFDEFRHRQWLSVKDSDQTMLDHSGDKKFGTVGAVARDEMGNLAAATSTGGMTNKKFNRIGDTPVIGSGTYASNNSCAVSCTGHGEFFLRSVVAYDVACLMMYKGLSLVQACEEVVLTKLVRIGGEGGLIAVDANGEVCMTFNCDGMYRGMVKSGESPVVQIYR